MTFWPPCAVYRCRCTLKHSVSTHLVDCQRCPGCRYLGGPWFRQEHWTLVQSLGEKLIAVFWLWLLLIFDEALVVERQEDPPLDIAPPNSSLGQCGNHRFVARSRRCKRTGAMLKSPKFGVRLQFSDFWIAPPKIPPTNPFFPSSPYYKHALASVVSELTFLPIQSLSRTSVPSVHFNPTIGRDNLEAPSTKTWSQCQTELERKIQVLQDCAQAFQLQC